jgi:flagellar secretion chaperone FliS
MPIESSDETNLTEGENNMTYATSANSRYLDGRVLTASQPELQLLLLDGALRFGRQAEQLWHDDAQRLECDHLLTRATDILEALVQGLATAESDVSKRLADEYAFAFRQVALAQLNHDQAPLADALRLLDFERETWRLACEQVKSIPAPAMPMPAFAGGSLSLQG